MLNKDDFFIEENKVLYVPNEDYQKMDMYVQFLEAVSRMTNKSIYVIDYFKKNFLHVSQNALFLCGMSAEKVKDMGYDFYLHHVAETDLPLLLTINRIGFSFAESIDSKNRLEYTLSYDFNMIQPSGKRLLIHHEITPLHLTQNGEIWLALCLVSLSSQTNSGNIEITRQGHNLCWRYDIESNKWIQYDGIELRDYEKDILRLSAQGYTINEISDKIYKSIDTIKGYRRVLFEKLGAGNITEAISIAIQYKLI